METPKSEAPVIIDIDPVSDMSSFDICFVLVSLFPEMSSWYTRRRCYYGCFLRSKKCSMHASKRLVALEYVQYLRFNLLCTSFSPLLHVQSVHRRPSGSY